MQRLLVNRDEMSVLRGFDKALLALSISRVQNSGVTREYSGTARVYWKVIGGSMARTIYTVAPHE